MSATRPEPRRQRGAAIITALFLVTGLAALGAFMWRSLAVTSHALVSEWDSAQALYAAESAVQWSAWRTWQGLSAAGSGLTAEPGAAWFDSNVTSVDFGGHSLVTITATGMAGGAVSAPRAQRRLRVSYFD